MIAALHFNSIAEAVALRAVNSLIISALVAPFALLLLRVSPRSATVRFAVWFSALLAIALFPWIDVASGVHISAHTMAPARAAITAPATWAIYLFAAWAGIAALGLARLCWALWEMHELRSSLAPLDPSLLAAAMQEKLDRQRQQRPILLCTSDRVSVPTAVGLVKPAVVIPSWLIEDLSSAELNQILLHEVAHLQRWDDWTNLVQKIVKALFFFHPGVWWIERKVSLEREMACDDIVLAESGSPRAYAACLVHLAERSVMRRSLALAQAAVGRLRQTSLRVAQILDGDRAAAGKSKHGWRLAVSLVGAFAVACVVGIARAPQLVAFDEVQPRIVASSLTPTARRFANPQSGKAAPRSNALPVRATSGIMRPRVIEAKSVARSFDPGDAGSIASNLQPARVPGEGDEHFVHSAALRQNTGIAQTVLVVVEQDEYGSPGQPVHGVSVWYILVVHSPAASAQAIPRKET